MNNLLTFMESFNSVMRRKALARLDEERKRVAAEIFEDKPYQMGLPRSVVDPGSHPPFKKGNVKKAYSTAKRKAAFDSEFNASHGQRKALERANYLKDLHTITQDAIKSGKEHGLDTKSKERSLRHYAKGIERLKQRANTLGNQINKQGHARQLPEAAPVNSNPDVTNRYHAKAVSFGYQPTDSSSSPEKNANGKKEGMRHHHNYVHPKTGHTLHVTQIKPTKANRSESHYFTHMKRDDPEFTTATGSGTAALEDQLSKVHGSPKSGVEA